MCHHVFNGSRSRPLLRVQPCVNHQAQRAPDFHIEPTIVLMGSLVKTHVNTQSFAVERPPFDTGAVSPGTSEAECETAEGRQFLHLLNESHLHQMSRPRLMQCQREMNETGCFRREARHPVYPRACAVGG